MKVCENRRLFMVSSQRMLIDIPFMIIFILCSIFPKISFSSYVSLAFCGVYLIYLLVFRQSFFLKYLAIVFAALVSIVGAAIVEFTRQLYLPELQCSSGFVGSLPLLILSYWILLITLLNYDEVYGVEVRKFLVPMEDGINRRILNGSTIVVLIMFMLLFSRVITHPAFLLGIDRFAYASIYSVSGVLSIIDHISAVLLIFPILSLIYGNKFLGEFTILVYVLYYLWIGNKFGPFFTLMCVFFLVYYGKILKRGKHYLHKIIVIACILGSIVFAYAIYFTTSTSDFDSASYVLQRGAQQGQLWWKTYDLCDGIHHMNEFGNEFEAIVHNSSVVESVGANNGIYKIMYLCAPKFLVDAKLMTGSRYTEAGYATIYYYFGMLGTVLFSLIMGFVFALLINSFLKSLNNKEYIKSMILLRLFLIGRGSLTLFTFSDYLDFISLVSYLYLIVMWNKKLCVSIKAGLQFRLVNYKVII